MVLLADTSKGAVELMTDRAWPLEGDGGMSMELSPSLGLVDRARAGDHPAWEDLYKAAYPNLMSFAHYRLGNIHDAKDAIAETMGRAVRHIKHFDGDDTGFTAWLIGICRHVIADLQRSAYKHDRGIATDAGSYGSLPDEDLLLNCEHRLVRSAFARLDREEQELLSLRVIARLSSDDVALALGKKPSAIRMAQMRALGKLKVFMEEASRV